MQVKIFLCHASEDKTKVLEVYRRLKAKGFKPWIDKEDLLPGQDWDREIRISIKQSDIALAFFFEEFSIEARVLPKGIETIA